MDSRGSQTALTKNTSEDRSLSAFPNRLCNHCGYPLAGVVTRCSECGGENPLDAPRVDSPLTRRTPMWFISTSAAAILRSSRLIPLTYSRVQAPAGRVLLFALTWMVLLIALWPFLKLSGVYIYGAFVFPESLVSMMKADLAQLLQIKTYARACRWPAWDVLHWWGLLAAAAIFARPWGGRADAFSRAGIELGLVRVMLLAPWIALTDVLHLVGVWIAEPGAIPETSTMFHLSYWKWDYWLMPVWLVRGAIPSMLLIAVFARVVLEAPWRRSWLLGLVLAPVAINFTILWSLIFMRLFMS